MKYLKVQNRTFLLFSIPFLFSFIFLIQYLFPFFKHNVISDEQSAFEKVYREKKWGEGSGIGSWPVHAKPYLEVLQIYLNDPKYKTIVDLGCGDWKLMEKVTIPDEKEYIGYDLVDSLIKQNSIKYAKRNIKFRKISKLKDIKNVSADLLVVKDVLHHWPNEHINYFLTSILPNYKYALITNDYNFFASNGNIQFGDFRPINLQAPPFVQIEGLKVYMDYPAHGITKRIYLYTKP